MCAHVPTPADPVTLGLPLSFLLFFFLSWTSLGFPQHPGPPLVQRKTRPKFLPCSSGSSGPAGCPHHPSLGRAHLRPASFEGSGKAGQAVGAERLRGLQLLYLKPLGLFTSWGCGCPPASPGYSSLVLAAPRGRWHLARPHRAGQTDH